MEGRGSAGSPSASLPLLQRSGSEGLPGARPASRLAGGAGTLGRSLEERHWEQGGLLPLVLLGVRLGVAEGSWRGKGRGSSRGTPDILDTEWMSRLSFSSITVSPRERLPAGTTALYCTVVYCSVLRVYALCGVPVGTARIRTWRSRAGAGSVQVDFILFGLTVCVRVPCPCLLCSSVARAPRTGLRSFDDDGGALAAQGTEQEKWLKLALEQLPWDTYARGHIGRGTRGGDT